MAAALKHLYPINVHIVNFCYIVVIILNRLMWSQTKHQYQYEYDNRWTIREYVGIHLWVSHITGVFRSTRHSFVVVKYLL